MFYVLGFRVSGLRGSSVKDPTPKHEKRTTSPMPKILTPATFFSFPVNAPEGSRATHTFCPYGYLVSSPSCSGLVFKVGTLYVICSLLPKQILEGS